MVQLISGSSIRTEPTTAPSRGCSTPPRRTRWTNRRRLGSSSPRSNWWGTTRDIQTYRRRSARDASWIWWRNESGLEPDEEGARLASSRCNLRSELGNKFYTGAPMVKLQMNEEEAVPALAPSVTVPGTTGGKNNSARKLPGIILPIVFVAAAAAITLYI